MTVVLLQKRTPAVRLVEIPYRFLRTVDREAVILEPPGIVGRKVKAVDVNAVVSSVDTDDVDVLAVRAWNEHVDGELVRGAGVGWLSPDSDSDAIAEVATEGENAARRGFRGCGSVLRHAFRGSTTEVEPVGGHTGLLRHRI